MRFKVDYKHFLALYILTTWVCAVTCIATTMRLESIVHDKSFRQLSTTRLFTSRPDNVDDKHLQQKPFRRRKSSKTTKPIAVSIATPHLTETRSNNSPMIHWRLSNLEIPLSQDPGKDHIDMHAALLEAVKKSIGAADSDSLDGCSVKVVRKSFDGRWKKKNEPYFVYTVDLEVPKNVQKRFPRLTVRQGKIDLLDVDRDDSVPLTRNRVDATEVIAIVGAGPAGLFAALSLIEAGIKPIIFERGKPVELRGKSIGALFNRKILDPESNLCYGEGGAGTWSDGKLTTRIGKNSEEVRSVLSSLVQHGAPERILVDGKPHLGTDRLVRILKALREYLCSRGAVFAFDTKIVDLIVDRGAGGAPSVVRGVIDSTGRKYTADKVILSVGHSARQLYEKLLFYGVQVEPKPFAAGFRIEHPQELINKIQFGSFGLLCEQGNGPVPVADYRLVAETTTASGGPRSCYSFCMCPGGQIVPTSINEDELCINGMSFSKRQSKWANSALVVNIHVADMIKEMDSSHPLVGVDWQRKMEQRAAVFGGGKLVVPVQRATDFMTGALSKSETPITSSYRLGVKETNCHEIYPPFITEAIRNALLDFDKRMPGFLCEDAILHGVETRTSAPIQITRHSHSLQSVSMDGLYPAGEGAGYAGGIVSAAVDGMRIGRSIIASS